MEQYAYERLPAPFHLMDEPILLDRIEIIEREGNFFYRVIDRDGDQGIVQGNPKIALTLSMTEQLTAPWFLGKDLRYLYDHMAEFYRQGSSYKLAGVLYWNNLSHLELAVLDLLGKKKAVNAAELLKRPRLRDEIPLYLTNINRRDDPQVIMDYLKPIAEDFGFRAVKYKIGGRMSHDGDARQGWTEGMLLKGRETFDSSIELYVDANSSYTPEKAIEMGRRLEELNYQIFEEPIEWNNIPGHREVARALTIPVATGEQETNMHNFAWLLESGGADIIQPDLFYCGGLFRSLLVCDMADKKGIPVMPHSPKTGPALVPMLHCVSMISNPGRYHECLPPSSEETWYTPALTVKNGTIKVPDGPGLGMEIDNNYLSKGDVLLTLAD